jgi:hypothetical protein
VDFYETYNARGRVTAEVGRGYDLELGLNLHAEEGGAAYASSGDVTGATGGRLSEGVLQEPIGDHLGQASRKWGRAQARLTPREPAAGGWTVTAAYDRYTKRFEEELDYRPGR